MVGFLLGLILGYGGDDLFEAEERGIDVFALCTTKLVRGRLLRTCQIDETL